MLHIECGPYLMCKKIKNNLIFNNTYLNFIKQIFRQFLDDLFS